MDDTFAETAEEGEHTAPEVEPTDEEAVAVEEVVEDTFAEIAAEDGVADASDDEAEAADDQGSGEASDNTAEASESKDA